MQIMISWSGSKSLKVAHVLRDALSEVFPEAQPWVSDEDLKAGARWPQELAAALNETHLGILCLTRENRRSPWILFEAGALSKSLTEARVIPFLLDVDAGALEPPLGHFHGVGADEGGVKKLVRAIADAWPGEGTSDVAALSRLEPIWPDLERRLNRAHVEIGPRIALFGATTNEIEPNSERTAAMRRFYRSLLSEAARSSYGINCCGAEPVRQAFLDAYCEELSKGPRERMPEVDRRVRWYWFPGDTLGFNQPPAFYEDVRCSGAIDRTRREIADSNVIVALAGRSGTREQIERILRYDATNSHEFSLKEKPMIILGWFGGTAKAVIDEHQEIGWLLDSYAALEPRKLVEQWFAPGVAETLAERLVRHLQQILAGEDEA